jgi:hypothetical protein
MSIRTVIADLGGITKLAKGLNHKNVTTVQGWWDREVIPATRQREVLNYAESVGRPIDPAAIIPAPKSSAAVTAE